MEETFQACSLYACFWVVFVSGGYLCGGVGVTAMSFSTSEKDKPLPAIATEVFLTREEKLRIESLAASFVEGSGFLMGLSNAIAGNVKVYVAEERRRQAERRDR